MGLHPASIATLGAAPFAVLLLLITSTAADDTAACTQGTGASAIAACTRVISAGELTNHDLALVFDYRGLHFLQAHKLDTALADYNKAIQLDPNSAIPYGGRGQIFFAKGDFNRAVQSLSAGLRLDPSVSYMYSLRGDSYAKKEQYDLAIADYNTAIKIDPKSELAFAGRGESYFQLGDYDRAIADLSLAVQLDPHDAGPYAIRGRTYAKKGDYGRAIADLTTAINIPHPRADFVYLVRADAYENHGDLKEALADYRKAAVSADTRLAKEASMGIQRVESKIARAVSSSVKLQSAGSGFVVSNSGYVLTNYHVVEGCSALKLGSSGDMNKATIFAKDENNDLAVLRSAVGRQTALSLREGRTIRPADQIILIGFPLTGTQLLSTSANISMGSVSALAGPNDDSRWLQISAPIQPGNSGGPVLDLSGNVVGIVVATLNAAAMFKSEGIIPQNINFAIKGNVIKDFLDAKGVPYETARSETKIESSDVAAKGARSTVLIECYK